MGLQEETPEEFEAGIATARKVLAEGDLVDLAAYLTGLPAEDIARVSGPARK